MIQGKNINENIKNRQLRHAFRKRKNELKSDTKKIWSGVKSEMGVERREAGLKIARWDPPKKRCLAFLWIEKKTSAFEQRSSQIGAPWLASAAATKKG